jgi:hypothetical protein
VTRYNWDAVPRRYSWVATDRNWEIWAFEGKPETRSTSGIWFGSCEKTRLGKIPDAYIMAVAWEQSLEMRPTPPGRYAMLYRPDEVTKLYDDELGRYLTWGQIVAALNEGENNER